MTDPALRMLEEHGVNLRRITAWTRAYNAFVMGGSCHYALASDFECDYPVHLGKGFYGAFIHGPNEITRVAELTSGAIVGDTLEEVMKDIEACEHRQIMIDQIDDGKAFLERTRQSVDNDEFWKRTTKR
ncbi:hypothetical protein EVB95_149 [Rhizobium phage RHph_TM2_3B]|nr:hypothetical protein EVB95_149 [Rhizobium phage RHph_TM2_3B]